VQTQQDTNSQASILIDDVDEKGPKRKRSGKQRLSGGTQSVDLGSLDKPQPRKSQAKPFGVDLTIN
jgi:hypothetical protein